MGNLQSLLLHFLPLLRPLEFKVTAKVTPVKRLPLKRKESIKRPNTPRKLLEKPWLNSSLSMRNSKREELHKTEPKRNLERLKIKKKKVRLPNMLLMMPRKKLNTTKMRLIRKIRLTNLKMIKMTKPLPMLKTKTKLVPPRLRLLLKPLLIKLRMLLMPLPQRPITPSMEPSKPLIKLPIKLPKLPQRLMLPSIRSRKSTANQPRNHTKRRNQSILILIEKYSSPELNYI